MNNDVRTGSFRERGGLLDSNNYLALRVTWTKKRIKILILPWKLIIFAIKVLNIEAVAQKKSAK